jgi:lipoprotein-releasing system permease protein
MALVIVLSAFNGLSDLVQSLYNSFDPDLSITIRQGKTFDPSSPEFAKIKSVPGVAYYSEIVEGNALLKFNDKQCVATIKGVGDDFRQMSGFDSLVTEGKFNISKSNMVMGKGISYLLQAGTDNVFTPVSIYAPKRGAIQSMNPEDGLTELKAYTAGCFSINDEFDYKYVIMSLDRARALLDYTNQATSIELGLSKDANRDEVQKAVQQIVGNNFEVKNKEQQNALLYKTLKSEKLWTFLILIFILVIATFNVIGSITMLIIEKKKDISILHYLGADIQLIRKIFLVEGLFITFIGAVSGLLLGLLVCWLQIEFSLVRFTEGYVVDAYPIAFKLMDFILIISSVMLIGLFAAWYPVRVYTKRHLSIS